MSSVPDMIPTVEAPVTQDQMDHFPWSDLEDLEYEIWATKEEIKSYDNTMAKIDAEGGDISAELYPPSEQVAEPVVVDTEPVIPDEQAT